MEERLVRSEQIRLIKYDTPEVNIRYTGRSKSMRASDSDKAWQIQLEYKVGDVVISTYALMGQFECTWDDRASYFSPAPTPDPTNPLGGIVSVTGTFTTSGLKNGGLITVVSLNDTTWTALPPTALPNRNAILVQNQSLIQARMNYDDMTVGYVGININADGELYRDITDNIIMYAKSSSGNIDVVVEELS